jgi:hypothetical protein
VAIGAAANLLNDAKATDRRPWLIMANPPHPRRIELGGEPFAGSPEELDARLRSDIDMWAAVVKKAGLEPN